MSPLGSGARRMRYAWPWLALLVLALLGCNRGLWTPDEPREAEIGREMALAPGLIPTLDGRRFIEKPPLYYWVMAGAYRLAGGPSVLAARSVSVGSGLATLALLYAWAAAVARSRAAGLTCAFMLASSVQFLVSTHWVLLDPLLMLATTAAAWAAWWLLASEGDCRRLRGLLYASLVAALWIKGPIGPVLIGAGLAAYVLIDRPIHWRRLRPVAGCILLATMLGALALAIYAAGGRAALWEWGYVNHVQRLLHPGATGHRQPLLYYVWTLPYAALPWVPALLEALRPSHWRRVARAPDAARYGALMSAAMLLLLSLSATKRETYLLPVLPLLFLWLGLRAYRWWQQARQPAIDAGSVGFWRAQVALLCVYAFAAPVAAWVWTRALTPPIALAMLLALSGAGALLLHRRLFRGVPAAAGVCALATAVTGAAVLLALAGPVLLPGWLLIQNVSHARDVALPPDYHLVMSQSFGAGRSLALWHRQSSPAAADGAAPG